MKTNILIYSILLICLGCQSGPSGSQGSQGVQGLPGTPANQVTVVQFCPGVSHYPSTFPEDGLCIDGSIYAVYSANDGFLTEVVPGVYSSNAVGSSCTFTVLPGCVILPGAH